MDRMNRRDFLQATTGSAAALAVAGASAAGLPPLSALQSATGVPVLYDPRFPTARARAAKLAGTRLPVQALPDDANELMQDFATGRGPRRLIGITAESVPFCLTELCPRSRRPTLTLHRLDQDLFAWHLVHTA